MPLVTIQVQNDLPSPTRVASVLVSIYDTDAVFQTSATTNGSGEIAVTLPDGVYDIYLFKAGLSVFPRQPHRITIDSLDPLPFVFRIICHVRTLPESIHPRRCTLSGKIIGIDGLGTKSHLVFTLIRDLVILDDDIIDILSRREIDSDQTGYFEFELLRGQSYYAYFLYLDSFMDIPPPARLKIIVPDSPGAELDKLLFPVPLAAEFSSPTATILMTDPPNEDYTIDVVWSDGSSRWESYAWAGLELLNDHPEVVDFCVSFGRIQLKPLSPGVAVLGIRRKIASRALFDPLADFETEDFTVTVSP